MAMVFINKQDFICSENDFDLIKTLNHLELLDQASTASATNHTRASSHGHGSRGLKRGRGRSNPGGNTNGDRVEKKGHWKKDYREYHELKGLAKEKREKSKS